MPAKFISIDGVDGCGKSTQIGLLANWLERAGQPVITVRDPGGTRLGESLREILLQRIEIPLTMTSEMLMYMASRSQLVEEIIEPALQNGHFVISDRYLLANVVYQGCAGGLDPDTIWEVGKIATRGRLPDLTVLMDLHPEVALQRLKGTPDRMESRGLEYMQKVREGFLQQVTRLADRLLVIDASATIDAIHGEIVRHVIERLVEST